jgi:HEAT repeat protein
MNNPISAWPVLVSLLAFVPAGSKSPPPGVPVAKGKAVSYWIEKLKSKNPDHRLDAFAALGGVGRTAKEAVPVLIEILKEGEVRDRFNAAHLLGQMGPDGKAAVPALAEALKEKEAVVRGYAILFRLDDHRRHIVHLSRRSAEVADGGIEDVEDLARGAVAVSSHQV